MELKHLYFTSPFSSAPPLISLKTNFSPKFLSPPSHHFTLHLSSSSESPFKTHVSSFSISEPSDPIFLPVFDEEEDNAAKEEEEKAEEQHLQKNLNDPIFRFFKTRSKTPNQDPVRNGEVRIQSNRRSSCHPAETDFTQTDEEDEDEYYIKELEQLESGVSSSTQVEGVLGEILQLAKNIPENSTLDEALDPFVGKIREDECVEMLNLLVDEGLVTSCLYFFEWMWFQEPSLVSPRAYSVMFTLLGVEGMGDKLMILYRNLPQTEPFRDVRVYNSAISGFSFCRRFDEAWEVYATMDTNNIQPDHVTCSTLLAVIRRSGRSAKDAWEFFERMNKKGVKWSVEAFGALIKSFCDEGLKDEAIIIQLEMEKKGISSNTIIYNTLMDAYVKSNQIEEAEGLFIEMKEKGFKPTCVTYNILMNAYTRRMQPEIIEDMLLEMRSVGLEPNAKSFTCLISAYGKMKDDMSDKAADAFLRMKKFGIKPTSHSYTALIHAYAVNGWHEKANISFENMKREGIKPSVETYTALLDAYRRVGDTQSLIEIWKLMRQDKVKGTTVTFNTLLDGFAKQGHYSEARDVVSEFRSMGHQPTVMTYNMLINAYARGGQDLKVPELLQEMEKLNLKPNSVTYSTIIYAYIRVRDFERAFYYHKQMIKNNQVPDVKSYEKLKDILKAKSATKSKRDRKALWGLINYKAGIVKEKKKGKKDEFWKNKRKPPSSGRPHGTRRFGTSSSDG